jgi:hypothetical protein
VTTASQTSTLFYKTETCFQLNLMDQLTDEQTKLSY